MHSVHTQWAPSRKWAPERNQYPNSRQNFTPICPTCKKTNRCQTIFNSSPFARGSLQEYSRKMKPFPPLLISPRPPVDRTLLSKVSSLSQILWNARRKCSVRIVSCRHFSKVKFVRAATTPAKEDRQIKCSQNRAVQWLGEQSDQEFHIWLSQSAFNWNCTELLRGY